MYTVIDNDNREWADAPTISNAVFAMEQIGAEEHIDLRAVDESGKVVALVLIDRSGGYEPDDPKSEGYHDRMADIYDMREGK